MIRIDEETKEPIKLHPNVSASVSGPKQSGQNMFIQLEEQKPLVSTGQIKFIDFNGYWKNKELNVPNLKKINLHIKPGSFCGITGKVGSGKSGLLGVLLDEIPYYSGYVLKEGSISYAEQQPIIFSSSIKENILFGSSFNEERYKMALKDSCLVADLQLLENGEDTVVGERGVTLSGGQKARLALARAIYIDADIYLFDDPISAVDSKVAKQIYQRVMLKLWEKQKTVILVTHQITYLLDCDAVVIMDDGKIAHHDKPQNLKEELKKFQLSEKEQEANEKED